MRGEPVFFDCEGCGRTVSGAAVAVDEELLVGGRRLVIRDVPADACDDCGALRVTTETETVVSEMVASFAAGRSGSEWGFSPPAVFGREDAA